MKLNRLILLGFLLLTGILKAQTDFKPGYVINISGDTLLGEIDYRGDLRMSKICKFKNSDNTIEEYTPNDIAGYRFIDSKYYISKEIDSQKVFLEYLIKGEINIYYLRDENGENYYLDKKDVKLTKIPFEEGIKYIDNTQYYYSSTAHYGLLYLYMQDAPNIQKQIKTVKTPQHQNLIKLAENYHKAVCDGEKCIIYEKKQPFIKINPELVGGILNIKELKGEYFFHGGIITNLCLPRLNEKTYIRTGLLYSEIQSEDETQIVYKIPIQIGYIYPKSIIRPKFSVGLNIYQPFYQTLGLMGGVNIKLNRIIYFSIDCDMDFTPNEKFALIPQSSFSYSILSGIYLKF